MNKYYIGLVLKILLLAAFVVGVFFGLQAIGYRFLAGPEPEATAAEPRNILLVLIENWEKTLLADRGAMEKQRAAYLDQLKTASAKAERASLEASLKALERKYVQNNGVLAGVAAELSELAAREKDKNARLAALSEERLKADDALFNARLYWTDYTEKIKNLFLTQVKTDADRGKIVQAFQEDNGLSFITAVGREYFAQGKELTDIKGDTTLQNTLDKTTQAKAELEAVRRDLEKKIKDLQVVVTSNESDIRLMKTQIETLLDVGQFNGFFISRNNRTEIIVNPKRQNDILSTGQFIVYNNKKAPVSKIYVSKKNNQIVYTKLPGYDEPKPGTYF